MITKNKQVNPEPLFGRENYILMLIGLIIMGIGFFVMAGGKSADPMKFNDNEIYSFTRITLAPILIMTAFVIEIFAIMKKPKTINTVKSI